MNERIRVPQVRLINEEGAQVGVIDTNEALRYAQERDLDLVEVAAEARPPVCRVLDYSKYKYEQEQKAKAARKHQQNITVREIKLRPKIATNDYETKRGHVKRFLTAGAKVKVTIMFRGREVTHPERGEDLLMRLAEDIGDLGQIEQRPSQDGRNMTMMLGPAKTQAPAEKPAVPAPAPAEASADVPAETPADVPAETPADVPAETPAEPEIPPAEPEAAVEEPPAEAKKPAKAPKSPRKVKEPEPAPAADA